MNCPNCGKQHVESGNFCEMCGCPLNPEAAKQAAQEVAAAAELSGRIEPVRIAELIKTLGELMEKFVKHTNLTNEEFRFLALMFRGAADLADPKPKQ